MHSDSVRGSRKVGPFRRSLCIIQHCSLGGVISPLLANILLDDLDKELEQRGHCFCRYADDCNIYVRSQEAGERVMTSVVNFLEGKLRLKVNRKKSAVAPTTERAFLIVARWAPRPRAEEP